MTLYSKEGYTTKRIIILFSVPKIKKWVSGVKMMRFIYKLNYKCWVNQGSLGRKATSLPRTVFLHMGKP